MYLKNVICRFCSFSAASNTYQGHWVITWSKTFYCFTFHDCGIAPHSVKEQCGILSQQNQYNAKSKKKSKLTKFLSYQNHVALFCAILQYAHSFTGICGISLVFHCHTMIPLSTLPWLSSSHFLSVSKYRRPFTASTSSKFQLAPLRGGEAGTPYMQGGVTVWQVTEKTDDGELFITI